MAINLVLSHLSEYNKGRDLYYLYFSYALIISCVVLFYSIKENESKWWGAIVFLSPVTAPFYFLKTRAKRGIPIALIITLIFICVCAGEYYIHFGKSHGVDYSKYPPVARQMIRLSTEMKIATNNLNKDIAQLNQLSRSESSLENMTATIKLIGKMRVEIIKTKAVYDRLSFFLKNYRGFLEEKNFGWLTNIEKYYNNEVMTLYFKKLQNYLDRFEALLQFTFKNFNKIGDRVPVALDNYDAYYMLYRGAMDDYNRVSNMRVRFQNQFLKEHPELVSFLPKPLRINSLELKSKLKLWD